MDKVWTGSIDSNIIAHGQLLFLKNLKIVLSQQNRGLARFIYYSFGGNDMDFLWTRAFLEKIHLELR